jgi:hypothetical protein
MLAIVSNDLASEAIYEVDQKGTVGMMIKLYFAIYIFTYIF